MSATVVCRLDELVHGEARPFAVGDRAIVVVRIGDDVYAIADRCSHANVALSDGTVSCDSREIECIRHGSAFSLVTGEPSTLPATKPVPVYVARVVDGDVVIDAEASR
jgi:3-phenylpropionate/trans-cinnamate dioxygenase ferredoxin subunit